MDNCTEDVQALLRETLQEARLKWYPLVLWDEAHERYRIVVDFLEINEAEFRVNYSFLNNIARRLLDDNYWIEVRDSNRENALQRECQTKYDVTVLHDVTQSETQSHAAFYAGIAGVVRKLGKSVFLPAEVFGLADDERAKAWFRGASDRTNPHYNERCKDLYTLVNMLVIPQTKIVIVDLGHQDGSEDVVTPHIVAQDHAKHIIYMTPTSYHVETVGEVLAKTPFLNAFGRKSDYPPRMLNSPYIATFRNGLTLPLRIYPQLWEVIRYDTPEQGFEKLEASVAKFFQENA